VRAASLEFLGDRKASRTLLKACASLRSVAISCANIDCSQFLWLEGFLPTANAPFSPICSASSSSVLVSSSSPKSCLHICNISMKPNGTRQALHLRHQVAFCPHYAVNGLRRRRADSAYRESLGGRFGDTVKAFRTILENMSAG
jgi:hypothetical protein